MTTHEEAELALLDMALAEQFDGAKVPDIWSQLQLAAPDADRRKPTRWLAAAVLLVGTAIVGLVMQFARPEPEQVSPLDQTRAVTTADGPRSHAEALARLAGTRSARAAALAERSRASGRWISLEPMPLEDLFSFSLAHEPALGDDVLAAVVTALQSARPAAAQQTVWHHAIDFAGPAGKVRLLVGTHDAQRCTAWVGKGGAIPIAATGLPLAQLEPVFRDATEKTLRKRGVAIGSDGLQGLPEDLQVLRWHEARGEDLAALRSFSKLRQLDLTGSPACHNAAAMRQLVAVPVRELLLCASWLDRAAYPQIASLTSLEELFLLGTGGYRWLLDQVATGQLLVPPAPHLDDDALTELSQLGQLDELLLSGGAFGERGLTALARLGKLERLSLIGCENVRPAAWRAFAGHGLKELGLAPARTPTSLAALAALPSLEKITLWGPLLRDELGNVAQLHSLTNLNLCPQPPLTDTDLLLLRGAGQLRRLNLDGSTLTQGGLAALRAALPQCQITDAR